MRVRLRLGWCGEWRVSTRLCDTSLLGSLGRSFPARSCGCEHPRCWKSFRRGAAVFTQSTPGDVLLRARPSPLRSVCAMHASDEPGAEHETPCASCAALSFVSTRPNLMQRPLMQRHAMPCHAMPIQTKQQSWRGRARGRRDDRLCSRRRRG